MGESRATQSGPATAFRWTDGTGMTPLLASFPALAGAVPRGISDDGGTVLLSTGQLWTDRSGVEEILSPDFLGLRSLVIREGALSADGDVFAFHGTNAAGDRRAVRWTFGGGSVILDTLGGDQALVLGISADGSTVIGSSQRANGDFAPCRWTQAGGVEEVSFPSLGGGSIALRRVSADGTRVLAEFGGSFAVPRGLYLWDESGPAQLVLEEGMMNISGFEVEAMSADGRSIACTVQETTLALRSGLWTEAYGLRFILPPPPFNPSAARAFDLSDDGMVMSGSFSGERFVVSEPWTDPILIGRPGSGGVRNQLSGDGHVTFGAYTFGSAIERFYVRVDTPVGRTVCLSEPNSAGCRGHMSVQGSAILTDNDLSLRASEIPLFTVGLFLASR
ncbi:MAG: hypothetical protein AAGG01_15775, partial [Planctomycetota bacterium]